MEKEAPKQTSYFFTFAFKAGGIIDSDLSLDEVKTRLTENLAAVYGEEGAEILELREASEEDLQQVQEYLGAQDDTLH